MRTNKNMPLIMISPKFFKTNHVNNHNIFIDRGARMISAKQTPFINLNHNSSNLLKCTPHFITYNIKIQMVYFEELRLLILLVMAYFSYRNISASALQAIQQYGEPNEDEESVDQENSQLEDESLPQQAEAELEGEKEGACVVEEVCQQAALPVLTPQCLNQIPSDELMPEGEVDSSDGNVLGEVDENEVVGKVGKRKMIKKSWRREKKESISETIIASEEQVESEVDAQGMKENQMIDI